MLSHEDNQLLTLTGPGTAMGRALRRYWIPAVLSSEIPEPDCPPVRVKLLGEELVIFRDSSGRIGLVQERCAHRCASLFFAANRENGLRCIYHGWKYDVGGNCLEQPSEPDETSFAHKVKLTAYPTFERGGLVWAYMGPASKRPGTPEIEWNTLPKGHTYISKRLQECNYFQAMEGGMDSSHISWLHSDMGPNRARPRLSKGGDYARSDRHPVFEVQDTDYGLLIGARRTADEDHYYWRITQWIAPWYTMIPPFGDRPIGGHAWVPADDETCWAWSFDWHPQRTLTEEEFDLWRAGGGFHAELMPGTWIPKRNARNNYLQDREAQRSGRSLSGIDGIQAQDTSVQESQGAIMDRSREQLGTTDLAIIKARRVLLNAARNPDQDPPGVDPASQRVRSVSIVLPKDVPWAEGAREALVASPDSYLVSA
jgi:phthalate 4,5-dioxygenase